MKVVWFCILLAVAATAFTAAGTVISSEARAASRTAGRMLKAGGFPWGSDGKGHLGLDDYQPVDPSPSSKAVRPGPINHGTPLIPYIPRPSPPHPPYP